MKPWTGIALMHEAEFIASALPLFEAGEIDVLEWSFDTISDSKYEPSWLPLLLQEYSGRGRLLAHGVRYSLLSGDFSKRQHTWLKQTATELKRYPYRHITEHFGFMTSEHFHKGAPLPVPLNAQSLAIGHDRLQRLQQIAGIPVGVENLAFAFSAEQVKEQGEFLEKLIEPLDGFLILDLHNVWCQAVNFDSDAKELIRSYPLHKVKEIHVSGGSWSIVSSSDKPVRRDTHDESVPEDVLRLLAYALPLCPNTEAVIFERLGNTLLSAEEQQGFASNYRAIRKIVESTCREQETPSEKIMASLHQKEPDLFPHINTSLKEQQDTIISLLTSSGDISQTIRDLKNHQLLINSGWQPERWTPEMIETAVQLLKKWN
jgi:uncharacterized protein (UPF0276 family)